MNKALTDRESRLKRLKFRSWHRGMKETDLILGSFADARLDGLSEGDLEIYEALLECDDDYIWRWLTGSATTPPEFVSIIAMLDGYGKPKN